MIERIGVNLDLLACNIHLLLLLGCGELGGAEVAAVQFSSLI